MLTLEVKKRDIKESLAKSRKEGNIPAVFYGPKEKSTPVFMKEVDFTKIWNQAGESTIISIKEGGNEHEALIHDISIDPVRGNVIHADFYIIEKGKLLTINVPLVFDGTSIAETKLGGVLVKVMHEIEVEALPKDLPHELHVSIDSLVDFEAQIHVKDIVVPEGVTIIDEQDEVVALVQEPKEEEEEPIVAPDLDSIEVVGKKKEDEEGDVSEDDAKEDKKEA